jgi:hypothetical protein
MLFRPYLQRQPSEAVIDMGSAYPPPQQNPFGVLQHFARKRVPVERCELCGVELSSEHEHLVEPINRKLLCACGPCAILFDAQSGTRYKRLPRRVFFLRDFQLTDAQWDALRVPIEMAFFFRSTPHERVIAQYPSPAGPIESLLPLDTWAEIEKINPVLRELQPDVMALLVNRVGHARANVPAEYYLVPIDECYKLVGLIRSHWHGLSGGAEVWAQISVFFDALRMRAGIDSGGSHA